jgi:hypothetical protein
MGNTERLFFNGYFKRRKVVSLVIIFMSRIKYLEAFFFLERKSQISLSPYFICSFMQFNLLKTHICQRAKKKARGIFSVFRKETVPDESFRVRLQQFLQIQKH